MFTNDIVPTSQIVMPRDTFTITHDKNLYVLSCLNTRFINTLCDTRNRLGYYSLIYSIPTSPREPAVLVGIEFFSLPEFLKKQSTFLRSWLTESHVPASELFYEFAHIMNNLCVKIPYEERAEIYSFLEINDIRIPPQCIFFLNTGSWKYIRRVK